MWNTKTYTLGSHLKLVTIYFIIIGASLTLWQSSLSFAGKRLEEIPKNIQTQVSNCVKNFDDLTGMREKVQSIVDNPGNMKRESLIEHIQMLAALDLKEIDLIKKALSKIKSLDGLDKVANDFRTRLDALKGINEGADKKISKLLESIDNLEIKFVGIEIRKADEDGLIQLREKINDIAERVLPDKSTTVAGLISMVVRRYQFMATFYMGKSIEKGMEHFDDSIAYFESAEETTDEALSLDFDAATKTKLEDFKQNLSIAKLRFMSTAGERFLVANGYDSVFTETVASLHTSMLEEWMVAGLEYSMPARARQLALQEKIIELRQLANQPKNRDKQIFEKAIADRRRLESQYKQLQEQAAAAGSGQTPARSNNPILGTAPATLAVPGSNLDGSLSPFGLNNGGMDSMNFNPSLNPWGMNNDSIYAGSFGDYGLHDPLAPESFNNIPSIDGMFTN